MSIGLLIVNPLLQQYKSLGTYGIFKKVLFPLSGKRVHCLKN